MAIKKSKAIEIQKMRNCINANKDIIISHPELAEKLSEENDILESRIEQAGKTPFKSQKNVVRSNQENVILGKCKAIVEGTGNPCHNTEVYGGYCLIHLKQRDPEMAEKYKIMHLKDIFGLTDDEISKIKKVNGTLNNINKALADFIKSGRVKI